MDCITFSVFGILYMVIVGKFIYLHISIHYMYYKKLLKKKKNCKLIYWKYITDKFYEYDKIINLHKKVLLIQTLITI